MDMRDLEEKAAKTENSIATYEAIGHILTVERGLGRNGYYYSYKIDGDITTRHNASILLGFSD